MASKRLSPDPPQPPAVPRPCPRPGCADPRVQFLVSPSTLPWLNSRQDMSRAQPCTQFRGRADPHEGKGNRQGLRLVHGSGEEGAGFATIPAEHMGRNLSLTWEVPTGNIPGKAEETDMLCPGAASGRSSGTNLSAGSLITQKGATGDVTACGKRESRAVVSGAGPSQVMLWPSPDVHSWTGTFVGTDGISPTPNRAMGTVPGRTLVFS